MRRAKREVLFGCRGTRQAAPHCSGDVSGPAMCGSVAPCSPTPRSIAIPDSEQSSVVSKSASPHHRSGDVMVSSGRSSACSSSLLVRGEALSARAAASTQAEAVRVLLSRSPFFPIASPPSFAALRCRRCLGEGGARAGTTRERATRPPSLLRRALHGTSPRTGIRPVKCATTAAAIVGDDGGGAPPLSGNSIISRHSIIFLLSEASVSMSLALDHGVPRLHALGSQGDSR